MNDISHSLERLVICASGANVWNNNQIQFTEVVLDRRCSLDGRYLFRASNRSPNMVACVQSFDEDAEAKMACSTCDLNTRISHGQRTK
jgi:hypothetical protein